MIACAAGVLAALAMTSHLDKPLLGPHSFRQTQTAISTFYMLGKPGMFVDYITPVLGKPWAIPMEVPFYQWMVARTAEISGASLDAVGQAVSAAAWFLCMLPAWMILRSLRVALEVRALAAAIFLSSPLYLFWGRSFMIETTGTLLSLCMVAAVLASPPRIFWLLAALVFGVAAALCKATTWAVAAGVGILLVVFRDGWPDLKKWKWQLATVAALALPVIPAKLWLAWGDSIKEQNPFARELIIASSPNQAAWNFGTLEQKLNPATWDHIWKHVTDQIFVPFPLLGPLLLPGVLIVGAVLSPHRIPAMLALLAGFVAGPVIFTNLYFEHSYYWCANGVWLLAAVGVALAGVWDFKPATWWPKAMTIGLTMMICLSGFLTWRARFLPMLKSLPARQQLEQAWTKPIQDIVPQNRTILIVGNDWNPNSLYYAGRKGIAFPIYKAIPFPGPQLEESLAKLEPDERLGTVVINPAALNSHPEVFEKFLKERGFSLSGQPTPFGILFPSLDLKHGEPPGS